MIQCTKCKEWFHRQCAGLVPRKAWRSKECILLSGIVVDARIEVTCMYNIYGLYDISMLYCGTDIRTYILLPSHDPHAYAYVEYSMSNNEVQSLHNHALIMQVLCHGSRSHVARYGTYSFSLISLGL